MGKTQAECRLRRKSGPGWPTRSDPSHTEGGTVSMQAIVPIARPDSREHPSHGVGFGGRWLLTRRPTTHSNSCSLLRPCCCAGSLHDEGGAPPKTISFTARPAAVSHSGYTRAYHASPPMRGPQRPSLPPALRSWPHAFQAEMVPSEATGLPGRSCFRGLDGPGFNLPASLPIQVARAAVFHEVQLRPSLQLAQYGRSHPARMLANDAMGGEQSLIWPRFLYLKG